MHIKKYRLKTAFPYADNRYVLIESIVEAYDFLSGNMMCARSS